MTEYQELNCVARTLKMRADYETKFVEIESSLSFSTDREYNRMLIQLNQSFYTLSFDIPSSLDGLFAPDVTPDGLARYIGQGNRYIGPFSI